MVEELKSMETREARLILINLHVDLQFSKEVWLGLNLRFFLMLSSLYTITWWMAFDILFSTIDELFEMTFFFCWFFIGGEGEKGWGRSFQPLLKQAIPPDAFCREYLVELV